MSPAQKAAQILGRKGGRVRSRAKARTSEQARAAVAVRWARYRARTAAVRKNARLGGRPKKDKGKP